jgi:hypothetical protein
MRHSTRLTWILALAAQLALLPVAAAQPAPQPTTEPGEPPSVETPEAPETPETPEATETPETPEAPPTPEVPALEDDWNHTAWNTVVSTYVDDAGRVDYAGLKANAEHSALLDAYTAWIASTDIGDLGDADKLAFYINAYNALVVNAVLDAYPIDSVEAVPGFFDMATYVVAGTDMTLNQLENDVLREDFEEPRIHFALVCAAVSCPPLRNEAYVGSSLDEQLEDQTVDFIRATTVIDEDNRQIHLSKIFEWYYPDFEWQGSVRGFVGRRLPEAGGAALRRTTNFLIYDDYNWALNDQATE